MFRSSPVSTLHSFTVSSILRTIIFLAILLNSNDILSQNQHIELIPAARSTDLPEIDINCIVQDSAGFLWIGTWKGLFRYDGRNVINFSQQFSSKTGRKISALYLDNEGKLWIGTYSEGLFIYNPKNQQINSFQSINDIKTGNIINISGGADNKVRVACYEGVFTYDLLKDKFDLETLVYAESGNSFRLTMAFEDSKGSLWIGSDQGLLRYNHKTKKIENTMYLKGVYIHKIQELVNGWIVVSSLEGTDMFDEINGEIVPMNTNPIASDISAEKGESYACLIPESQPDQLWVGLPSGVMIADLITGAILSRPVFSSGKEGQSFKVESMFEDR